MKQLTHCLLRPGAPPPPPPTTIFDNIFDFEMKVDSSPSNSKESLRSRANRRSNVYLPWNETLDDDVKITKKWRKRTIWSRVCDAAAQCLLGESRLSTPCPYMVHKTWRCFVQPINVVFLLNFREVTCHIRNLFITWQLINIHDWTEARWFVVGSNRGAPKLLQLPSATAWWTRDQPERSSADLVDRRACRKATWLSHG